MDPHAAELERLRKREEEAIELLELWFNLASNVVERTFSWFGQSRRLSKDYERLCETSEALIYTTMMRLMLRRLAHT
jgi:hypothetical protein